MDNMTIAWNFFIGKGLTPEATAAVLGTLRAETTTVNPLLVNRGDGSDGSDSIGIMQWNSARANKLRSRANWQTLEVQLEFAWQEMTTSDIDQRMRGKHANVNQWWKNNAGGMERNLTRKGGTGLPNGWQDFITGTDIGNLTRVFDGAYTRSGDTVANGKIERRVGWANDAFNRFAPAVVTTPDAPVNEITKENNPEMYDELTNQKGE